MGKKIPINKPHTSDSSLSRKVTIPLTPADVFLTKTLPYTPSQNGPNTTSSQELLQKFNTIKSKAIKAIREGKIFVLMGTWFFVRRDLVKRGWVEKITESSENGKDTPPDDKTLLEFADEGNEFERRILSNLVADYPADLVFTYQRVLTADLRYIHDFAWWNRIKIEQNKDFTYKDGLCRCLNDVQFSTIENKAEVKAPRAFNVQCEYDLKEFEEEYHLTLCRNLIYFLNENRSTIVIDEVPDEMMVSLIDEICDFISHHIQIIRDHIDIEKSFEPMRFESKKWDLIAEATINIIENDMKVYVKSKEEYCRLEQKIGQTTESSLQLWPYTKHDGYRNIWIVKPSNQCGGSGIILYDQYKSIKLHTRSIGARGCMIIQKYIERPLLIYNNKFDMRYFFMIQTDTSTVKLWEHSMCYLRFAASPFDISDLSTRVHLTNNSITRYLQNAARDDKLPKWNMWHVTEFQEYLASIEQPKVWAEKINPAMKKIMIGLIEAGIDEMVYKSKRFHIYGADFLITDDFDVYLLECNHSPALQSNMTVVTEVVFKTVLEDTLKVLLDFSCDSTASTGYYNLIHKIKIPFTKPIVHGLIVDGQKISCYDSDGNKNSIPRQMKLPPFIQYLAQREQNRTKVTNFPIQFQNVKKESDSKDSKERESPLKVTNFSIQLQNLKKETDSKDSKDSKGRERPLKNLRKARKNSRIFFPLCNPPSKREVKINPTEN